MLELLINIIIEVKIAIPINPAVIGRLAPYLLNKWTEYRLVTIAPTACIPINSPAIIAENPTPTCKNNPIIKIAPK